MNYQLLHSYMCPKQSWQLCLGCGAKVCGCHGLVRGQCPICYTGLLTNYYKIGHRCGYKGCKKPAAVAVPRVKFACLDHAKERAGYTHAHIGEGDGCGNPTYHTQHVMQALGIKA